MKIFLIGFMGSGKTSLGKKLAGAMQVQFFDLDQKIEEYTAKDIPTIFQQQGEGVFRQIEAEILRKTIDLNQHFVLSCGGGTPCFHQNMEYMKSLGTTIFLDVDQEILLGRLRKNNSGRPLITKMSDDEMKRFIEGQISERRKYYLQSKYILNANNPTIAQILKLLNYPEK